MMQTRFWRVGVVQSKKQRSTNTEVINSKPTTSDIQRSAPSAQNSVGEYYNVLFLSWILAGLNSIVGPTYVMSFAYDGNFELVFIL